jgi:hypothetical protein
MEPGEAVMGRGGSYEPLVTVEVSLIEGYLELLVLSGQDACIWTVNTLTVVQGDVAVTQLSRIHIIGCKSASIMSMTVLFRKVFVKRPMDPAHKGKTAHIVRVIDKHLPHQLFLSQNMGGAKLLSVASLQVRRKLLVQSVLDFQYGGLVVFYQIGVIAVQIPETVAQCPGSAVRDLPFQGRGGHGHLLGQILQLPYPTGRQRRLK